MLDQLVIISRAMQLYTHNAHNMITGPTFFEDHEELGDLYPKYESIYDSLVERMIGLNISINLIESQSGAVAVIQNFPSSSEPKPCFTVILQLEQMLCKKIQECLASHPYSEGTKQLLGGIADESEMRQYKLRQRTV